MDGSRNVWVLKPAFGSKGVGVRLLNNGLQAALADTDSQRIVQKYIERPLLVGGYKFDIRCWVLVTSWAPLSCWLYEECLLRFCSDPFTLDDLGNRLSHITNRTVQRSSLASRSSLSSGSTLGSCSMLGSASTLAWGSRPSTAARPTSAHRRARERTPAELAAEMVAERERTPLAGALWSGTQFAEHLRACGMGEGWTECVLPAIRSVAAATMRSGAERAERVEPRRDAFEIFGLDLVVDENLQPWLIEVNESPNLAPHGSALKESILSKMLSSAVDLLVEPEFRRTPPERVGGWTCCVRGGEPAAGSPADKAATGPARASRGPLEELPVGQLAVAQNDKALVKGIGQVD